MNEKSETKLIPMVMPNGSPAPTVMTEQDLITFLRLDTDGSSNPHLTLQYYRDKGLLKPIRIGKSLRYTRFHVMDFLDKQSEWTNRKSA